jgi:hypothetical protein
LRSLYLCDDRTWATTSFMSAGRETFLTGHPAARLYSGS